MEHNAGYLSPPKKRAKRHFSVSEKEAILNTFKTCDRNHLDWTKIEKVNFTAEAGHGYWSSQRLQHTSGTQKRA